MTAIKKILITTDGSVSGDGTKAGYGYVVRDDENDRLIGRARGGIRIGDIDQVEAVAVLQAVKYVEKKMSEGIIDRNAEIHLLSDSKRNEMIYNEGRIEPIEANLSRWREMRYITKDWNFKLSWIKAHVSEVQKSLMPADVVKKYIYNDMADSEAKKGRNIENEKEMVFSPKEGNQIQDGYIDPDPILSSIKVENSYPQKPSHSTINNSGNSHAIEETWSVRNKGKSKSTYLSQFANMRKNQQMEESKKNNTQPKTKSEARNRFTFSSPKQDDIKVENEVINKKTESAESEKNNKSTFKSKLKLARGRFNNNNDKPKFKTVEEMNAEQGYKGPVYK